MNRAAAEPIRKALLYEGYLLYPYRPSAIKNRQRWSFAVLYPPAFASGADAAAMRTECLARGGAELALEVELRFLQLVERGGWQEAVERTVALPELRLSELDGAREHRFACAPPDEEGARGERVEGRVVVDVERLGAELFKVGVTVENTSTFAGGARDQALLRSLASAHTLLGVRSGELVSLLDPPPWLAAAAASCRNVGTWPVLVGDAGSRDTMLSSPIILYDHPRVAPESPGDLFDAAEIDEILTLRILTLTADEKRELAAADPRARALLERTEALDAEALLKLHGALRRPALGTGDRVRLRPRARADIFDVALAGRAATIASVERDFEGRLYYVVTVDDDPGKDLGAFAHRFFFFADEVEPLE
jgi:hypothetical protein